MNLWMKNRKSIRFRVTALIIILIIVQASLLAIFLVIGGVLKQAEKNAFSSFSDKVTNRRDYLQREMNFNWANLDPYVDQISDEYYDINNPDEYFNNISNYLISMLRTTQATGAFVILDEGGSSTIKPALYIRDYDPNLNDYGNKDLYLIHGPSNLGNKLQIPLDQMWKYNIDLSHVKREFYDKPLSKASLTEDSKLLGYWSKPFQLFSGDSSIITYTIPLFDEHHNAIGVIGVEISEQQLCKFLPPTELERKDSYGYFIAYQEEGESSYVPLILSKAIQKRLFKGKDNISFNSVDSKIGIEKLKNSNSYTNIYLSMDELNLYQPNTPFLDNHWYLVGMMSENHLFSYVRRIQTILWVATVASVIIGVSVGYIVSHQFTKPISRLAKEVRESNKGQRLELIETGLTEVDELASAMQMASNELLDSTVKMSKIIELVGLPIGAYEYSESKDTVFITDRLHSILALSQQEMDELVNDKSLFIEKIGEILASPDEEEEDIYVLDLKPKRWIKMKYLANNKSTIGIIIDMTDEMLVKKQMIQDRDIDSLTGIYSRKAMQDHIENAILTRNKGLSSALLMFDLDNLKLINDTYGHKWGDNYIRHAVHRLTKISEKNMILGRRSGDEFTLLLYDFSSKGEIKNLILEFFEALHQNTLIFPGGEKKQVSVSAGLVWLNETDCSYDDYLQKADEALYQAKKKEKGCCYEYESMIAIDSDSFKE